ncbi:MFS transporter [Bradyrhizobium sp. STM 3562]|uniref:MFS transporter n=1 Tax=Bradyrhizobium sp. STM 3562 TaxID=578924 RepID=UPI00389006F7
MTKSTSISAARKKRPTPRAMPFCPECPLILSANRPDGLLATRLAFFVAGFGLSTWAPLVPLAKARLAVDDRVLGELLLCLGVGSVTAMLLAGMMTTRYGCKSIILAGGVGIALALPWLSVASTPLELSMVLLAFGASLGAIDVSMNVCAMDLERVAHRPLMSGFHALYSIGEVTGSAGMTACLSLRIGSLVATFVCSGLIATAMMVAWPRLHATSRMHQGPSFVFPHRNLLLLAAFAAVTFLVEGAMLDWSGLLLVDRGLVAVADGGVGYLLFSVAMTAGRLSGDAVVTRVGDRATIMFGTLPIMTGFAALLVAPVAVIAASGFLLIGLGASNVVPVLCRRAGKQKSMPAGLAITVITTAGYAGMLFGPAAVGFIANIAGLPLAFALLGGLMCMVTLSARMVIVDPT